MPEQGSAPSTDVNEVGVYPKVGVNPAETALFFRGENNGYEYQLTSPDSSYTGSFGLNSNGWTFLPGNLILQYGTVSAPPKNGTITFPKPFKSAFLGIQLTCQRDTASNSPVSYAVTQATPLTTADYRIEASGATSLFWMAIGI
jgi:hypothetical protein